MSAGPMARFDLWSLLEAAENAPPVEAAEVLAAELARVLDAQAVSLLVTNMSGTALVRMSHIGPGVGWVAGSNERGATVELAGSPYQEAMLFQRPQVSIDGERWRVLVPVTERGDALGLVELWLPEAPGEEVTGHLARVAHAFAYWLIAARRHTDLFERAQRDIAFSVPAEIQRRLLPPAYTVETGPFSLAGWLEPAHDVGGDTFDYSVEREYLHASLTDAMGHSTNAALLATLAVAALRNARRSGAGPAGQADAANAELVAHTGSEAFVTGLVMRVGLGDGRLEIVNAGHPRPFVLRHGQVEQIATSAGVPLGVGEGPYQTSVYPLEPGDRLVAVTDGCLERNAARVDLPAVLAATARVRPRELVRELAGRVVAATGGKLRDDATTLCVDWYGPGRARHATAGASRPLTTRA